jgi:hypothetical protein
MKRGRIQKEVLTGRAVATETVELGDVVRIEWFGHHYVGIYVGPTREGRCIVHNDRRGAVILSRWEEFASGHTVYVCKAAAASGSDRVAIAKRARELIGRNFDLLQFQTEGPCESHRKEVQSEK